MENNTTIINKVALSGIITLDLLKYQPAEKDIIDIDMVPYLMHDYLFREGHFRTLMKQIDWSQYSNKYVNLYCSNDAIVPYWAYVFITSLLRPFTNIIVYSSKADRANAIWKARVMEIDYEQYHNEKVVLKASSEVDPTIYVEATNRLMDKVKSLMWGEAGSPIMIYKKKPDIV